MYHIDAKDKDNIIKVISAFYPEAKIWLFGSFATEKAREGSDIDIAIDVGRQLDLHEWSFLWNLLDALPLQKIDLVDMHRIPQEMRDRILLKGVVWKI